ncbi:hypothetical protein GLW05_04915 [Pontibacillus yanchengensis]|uniref:Uncharacterized protein n=1 Tax=Pontibacillus yanchengensis TaxID=462910 RepID=A0A6I4ZRU6_9BACI|nr:hypothetical protein [Pontibacillus yanchengensis]MYL32935.1 hypothetical protein [Pontibacillus yanchengensis]
MFISQEQNQLIYIKFLKFRGKAENFLRLFEHAEIGEFVGRTSKGEVGYNTQIQLPNYINVYFTGTHVGTE